MTAKPESFRLIFTTDICLYNASYKEKNHRQFSHLFHKSGHYTNSYLKVRLPNDNEVILQSLLRQAHSKLLKKLEDFKNFFAG